MANVRTIFRITHAFYYIKMLYAHTNHKENSWINRLSTVIEVASSNPVTVPYYFFLILFFLSIISCAVACDFQQCGILTCVDSDEPVQPPFKLR